MFNDVRYGVGEIHQYISNATQRDPHLGIDDAIGDEAKAKKLLAEAQANLELAAVTGYTPELRRSFITGLSSGGPLLIIYGILIVAFISMAIAISLSELVSAIPNAGGQYYWTSKLAPPKYSAFASYMCGAFAWAGAVFTSASVTVSIATALVGMYVLGSGDANTTVETWQVFITYEIVNVLLVLFNIWEKPLARISQGALYISIFSFIVITITVLAKSSGHYQSARFVFVEFSNGTGWSSSAIAFIVGLINPNWSFSCLDAATHLAEETLTPQTDIPKAIIGTVIIGFLTSFSYAISMFFSMRNLDELLNSNTGVPIMDIFYQALQSKAGAIVLEVLILLTAIGCNIASHTWQARLCWSFARDEGLPGSRYWSKVNKRTGVPVAAHLMSCACFPPVMPVTAGNMNYVSVVIGVFGIYCVIYWFARGKYRFKTASDREKDIDGLTHQLSNQVNQLEAIVSQGKE
ncbi:hypothetical protein QCA50_009463 [Cerrena zonata]|uniref:Amino acid transporter n=1 Tax=Cerrena zonata TaxID=2478898 RepID=A0AAW0G8T8_9APHY